MKVRKDDNKYIYTIVGKNIKRIRKEKGLTQVQLADKIKYNEGTIANIENSSFQTFSLEFIYVISKTLRVPISEFFKDIDE
ncbi:MAG: helix-turn-helix transcriptional regulator [Bacilli bacterium]|nr:helix-turn-helix transcriptional regulator [Bacilli bacterium]MDD4734210.1 helix-turn-helix transcriptional regulator [Bacilli bacterium]